MIDSHELRRRDGTPQHDQRTAYEEKSCNDC